MWPLLTVLCSLSFAAKDDDEVGVISGSRVRTDFTNDYAWSVGLRSGLGLPLVGSARAWGPGWDWGLMGEVPTPASGLSVVAQLDRTRHRLRDGSRYLEDGWESYADTLDGGSVHRWLQAGVRWIPPLSGGPEAVAINPCVGILLGADHITTALDVPSTSGRVRLTSAGVQPTLGPNAGLLAELDENLDLGVTTGFSILMGVDYAEVDGPDRLTVTGRFTSAIELLGRF